jgi:frataxin-like iron-binding protein CyaY
MGLLKFNDFRNKRLEVISENVKSGKKLLKEIELVTRVANKNNLIDRELENKIKDGKRSLYFTDFSGDSLSKIKDGVKEIKLDKKEIEVIEKNEDFEKIKTLLSKNSGYVYNFAYFYFVEDVPFEELEKAYKDLSDYKDLLSGMARKFDQSFIDVSILNNFEVLIDQLLIIKEGRKAKRFLSKLAKPIRDDYNNKASKKDVEDFNSIAAKIDDIMIGDNKLAKSIVGQIFDKIKRYTTVKEVVKESRLKLKALDNADMIKFYKKIEDVNKKFGNYGADIVFDDKGILILDVKSYQANVILNKHTSHCIVSSESQWNNYVESPNTKQYYIYNFNTASDFFGGQTDNDSIIGITIDQPKSDGSKIYKSNYGLACHRKDDGYFADKVEDTLKKWEKEYEIDVDIFGEVLNPMSDEEYKLRESKKEANRNIVNTGLSIEDIDKYIKLGADINKQNGQALTNAVKEDDKEKVKFILDLGASVEENSNPTKHAKDMEMSKILVEAGAEPDGSLLSKDFALKNLKDFIYLVNAGADISYNSGEVIRQAVVGKITSSDGTVYDIPNEILKLLVDNIDTETFKFRRRIMPTIFDYGAYEALKLFVEKGIADLTQIDVDMLVGDDSIIDDISFLSSETPEQVKDGFERIFKELGMTK